MIKYQWHKFEITDQTHKHFQRVLKYVKRGFQLQNKMELYCFFLWLFRNKLISHTDSDIIQEITEGCYTKITTNDLLLYCRP